MILVLYLGSIFLLLQSLNESSKEIFLVFGLKPVKDQLIIRKIHEFPQEEFYW